MGWNDATMTVEIRPLMLKVYKSSDMSSVHLIISKSSTVNQLKKLGKKKKKTSKYSLSKIN